MPKRWTHKPPSWANGSTYRWRKVRAVHLKDNPWCVWCGQLANTVDHIDGTNYATQRYDPTMLRSLCAKCHAVRTARQGGHARAQAKREAIDIHPDSPRSRNW